MKPRRHQHVRPANAGRARAAASPRLITANETWKIEKLVPGGAGMARREDGSVGFAEGVLPGELIQVHSIERKNHYVRAGAFRVLEGSAERTAPPCPIADECGGCDWLHVRYDAQVSYKRSLLREALRRTGGFVELPEIEVEPSPQINRYRLRMRVHIDASGKVGFFARHSHRVIPIIDCAAALPELNQALDSFRLALEEHPALAPYFREAELRVAPEEPRFAVQLFPRNPPLVPSAVRDLIAGLSSDFSVGIEGEAAEFVQRWPLSDDLWLEVSPAGFVQVNWPVNLLLLAHVQQGVRERGARRFLDLYAGAGNFSLGLARSGLTGVSIEANVEAARAAERSLRAHGFDAVRVIAADVERALGNLQEQGERFDLVVVDPPRAGAKPILPSLARLAPSSIAYCSCDPVTLARDLRTLCGLGYALTSVRGFDMFPGTHHVEAVAWLDKAAPSSFRQA